MSVVDGMPVSQHRLDLGPLDLVSADGRRGSYWFDVVAEGFSVGQPGSVKEIAKTLLVHGDSNRRIRYTNRMVGFDVIVGGDDLGAVASGGETALALELRKFTNTLTWTPPDGYGPPTVFKMVLGDIGEVFYDLDQLQRGQRRFHVELECGPFTASARTDSFSWPPTSATLSSGATFVADNYLRFYASNGDIFGLSSVSINGTSISNTTWMNNFGVGATPSVVYVPTEQWRGQTVTATWSGSGITNVRTDSYPNRYKTSTLSGIGIMPIRGTAPAPCTITATAPSGGLYVYTAPDPNTALRVRNLGEKVLGRVNNAGPGLVEVAVGNTIKPFPPGDWVEDWGVTNPTPLAANPTGVYPTYDPVTDSLSFPYDDDAAVTVYTTTGAKVIDSAVIDTPNGYAGDAKYQMGHLLHPAYSGVGTLNNAGGRVSSTWTYTPQWLTNAGW